MPPKWSSKFELKPGKWVFVPTEESKAIGSRIKKTIEDYWTPPDYYYHLRSGGHVEAVKSHLGHTIFLHVDIKDFFGCINRSRVTRHLKSWLSYDKAREMASASTVRHPRDEARFIVPYGFVQSQIVAAFCLERSRLGTYLHKLSKVADVAVSVYVDDIIVSCNAADLADSFLAELNSAAESSGFKLNLEKQQGPGAAITAFNISVTNNLMLIDEDRLTKFAGDLLASESERQKAGILSYVKSVNVSQFDSLRT